MDLVRYIKIGLRWWWLILISMALSATASYYYSQNLPKIYSAKSTLTVGSNIIENPNPDVRNLGNISTLATVYGELATRAPIAQGVINKLGLNLDASQLQEKIQTNVIPQAQLLEIIVLDIHPQRAQFIANAIAEELILQSPTNAQGQQERETFIRTQLEDLQRKIEDTNQQIQELEETIPDLTSAVEISEAQSKLTGLENLKGEYQRNYTQFLSNLSENTINRLSIFELAVEPTVPISPNIRNNVLIAALAGLILAIVAIILLEFFDDTLVWKRDTNTVFGLPVLGTINKMRNSNLMLASQDKLWSQEADSLRTLRSSIFLATEKDKLSTLLVTSASPNEGKTFISSNLAVTITSSGSSMASVIAVPGTKVILIDADLRKPGLHEVFDLPNLFGLADVLAAPEDAIETMTQKALSSTPFENIFLLSAGRTPLDPGSLLNSSRFLRALQFLKTQADLIIIDSAPVLEAIETRAIANAVDGTVLVVSDGQSRSKDVKKAIGNFQNSQDNNLLGIVFNRVKLSQNYGYYSSKRSSLFLEPGTVKSSSSLWRKLWPFGQPQQSENAILSLTEVNTYRVFGRNFNIRPQDDIDLLDEDMQLATVEQELLDEKDAGKKIVGTYCVFVPEEIVLAANATMVGLCAGADFAMDAVEQVLPRNTCALIKSTFGFKLGKVCPYLEASDLIVGENTCDGKKKAYEIFGDLVPNFHVMDIPQMKSTAGRELLKTEYFKLKETMQALTGVTIDADKLKAGIATVNAKRRAMHRLATLRQVDPAPISGLDALLANQVYFYDNPARFTDSVNKICDELEQRVADKAGAVAAGAPRILISGCPMAVPNWKLPMIVEQAGAVIVGEESCVGERGTRHLVDDSGDTVDALMEAVVDRYFKVDCAIFTPNPDRLDHIEAMAKDYHADGVIHYGLQFCQPYLMESLPVEKALKEKSIPALRVETDYSAEDVPQLQTRVEAFLELLG